MSESDDAAAAFYEDPANGVVVGRKRRPKRMEPERTPESFKGHEGEWLAVKNGHEIVATGKTPFEVTRKVMAGGDEMKDAVIRYHPEYSDVIVIGLG
jgi:hypothetical protein